MYPTGNSYTNLSPLTVWICTSADFALTSWRISSLTCRPIGSMYVPNLAYTAAGPITTLSTTLVQLSFSQPIIGLEISQLNITLTPATGASVPSLFPCSLETMQRSSCSCNHSREGDLIISCGRSSRALLMRQSLTYAVTEEEGHQNLTKRKAAHVTCRCSCVLRGKMIISIRK